MNFYNFYKHNELNPTRRKDARELAKTALNPKEEQDIAFRLIPLLKNKYKPFTAIPDDRLKTILQNFFPGDQCGFLPKRHLRDNVRSMLYTFWKMWNNIIFGCREDL